MTALCAPIRQLADAAIAQSMAEKYRGRMIIDPSTYNVTAGEADSIARQFERAGIPCQPGKRSNIAGEHAMVGLVRTWFEADRIRFFSTCVHTIREHQAWRYAERKDGVVPGNEPFEDKDIRAGAYPQEYMPRELIEELEAAGVSPHASPNNIIPIDGANWERYFGGRGKLGFAVDAPQVNETFIRLVDMFLKLVDDLGGNAQVLQGRAPAGASGEAINTLTSNARGPLALKSEYAEQALARVARLVLDMAIKYMPDTIIARYFKSYPPALLSFLKNTVASMDFDVEVELASGKGANKRVNEQQGLQRLQAGAITLETAQEQMGVNVDLERQRREAQQQEQIKAAAAAQAALPQQSPPGVPGGAKPAPPGAGQ